MKSTPDTYFLDTSLWFSSDIFNQSSDFHYENWLKMMAYDFICQMEFYQNNNKNLLLLSYKITIIVDMINLYIIKKVHTIEVILG